MSMRENEKIVVYVFRLQTLVYSRKSYGETLTDQTIIEKIMRILTPQFDHVMVAIEESSDMSILKIK